MGQAAAAPRALRLTRSALRSSGPRPRAAKAAVWRRYAGLKLDEPEEAGDKQQAGRSWQISHDVASVSLAPPVTVDSFAHVRNCFVEDTWLPRALKSWRGNYFG